MDRDGMYPEYKKFNISEEQEKKWMNELTELKLDELKNKGNWNSIHFLIHHSNYNHLNEILNSEPLGKYWEKCAFLEKFYEMTNYGNLSEIEKNQILNYIFEKGNLILKKTKKPERIIELLDKI